MKDILLRPISKCEFFNELKAEVQSLMKKVPLDGTSQLSLQVTDPLDSSDSAWYDSNGKIRQGDRVIKEEEYKYTHPLLVGGYIDKWLTSFQEYKIIRARIMVMRPRFCYSIHNDPSPRIHIPIETNPHCLMLFPMHNVIEYMPANGTNYFVDTQYPHTFVNCSDVPRIHIVGAVSLQRLTF